MKSNKSLIKDFLDNLRTDINADLKAKDISDGWSMDVSISDDHGVLLGPEHYFYVLAKGTKRKPEGGRGPGPVSAKGRESLLNWIRKKGIGDGTTSEKSLVFLIARKLKNFGNDIYQGKRPGLDLDKAINDNLTTFEAALVDKTLGEFVDMMEQDLTLAFNGTK